jgi:hypothetical protein
VEVTWRICDRVPCSRVQLTCPALCVLACHSTELTYYKCKRVFDVLERKAAAAGNAGKSMFGQYNDRHLKEWSGIVSQFTQSCIHLADAAKVLVQLTTYEMYAFGLNSTRIVVVSHVAAAVGFTVVVAAAVSVSAAAVVVLSV